MKLNKILLPILLIFISVVSWSGLNQSKKEDPLLKYRIEVEKLEKDALYYDAYIKYQNNIFKTDKSKESYIKLLDLTEKLNKTYDYEKLLIEAIERYDNELAFYEKALAFYKKTKSTKLSHIPDQTSIKFPDYSNKELNSLQFQYTQERYKFDEVSNDMHGYYKIKVDNKYGLVDKNLNIIRSNFDYVGGYSEKEKVFPVKYEGKSLYIDSNGYKRKAIDEHVDELGTLNEKIAYIKKDNNFGFINSDMQFVSEIVYEDAGTFYNGIAPYKVNGKWGFVTSKMKTIVEPQFEEIKFDDFKVATKYNVFFAKKDGNWDLYNLKGEKLSSQSFEDARIFESTSPAAIKLNGKWTFIDTDGKIREMFFEDAYSFQGNKTFVKVNGKYYFVNLNLEKSKELPFKKVTTINSLGISKVEMEDKKPFFIKTYVRK